MKQRESENPKRRALHNSSLGNRTEAMAEEAPVSEVSAAEAAEQRGAVPNALETQASNEATIESGVLGGTMESTCNNDNISAATSDAEGEKSLELADQLMEKGSQALKDSDYGEAAEFFSRALEIRLVFSFFGFD